MNLNVVFFPAAPIQESNQTLQLCWFSPVSLTSRVKKEILPQQKTLEAIAAQNSDVSEEKISYVYNE